MAYKLNFEKYLAGEALITDSIASSNSLCLSEMANLEGDRVKSSRIQ